MKKSGKSRYFLVAAFIGLVAFFLYFPTGSFGIIDYDDQEYVGDNDLVRAGITFEGIGKVLTSVVCCNWHPLTILSYMTDVTLFGYSPGMFHLVNAACHAVNSILLFVLLAAGTGAIWRSCLVALIFAVHPVNVESVAWISERKNVLSTAFWFAGMLGYVLYVKRNRRSWFAFALVCCVCGLLVKPMLVSFPLTILLLDFWPLGRFSGAVGPRNIIVRRIVLEKAPFVIVALIFCIVTVFVQKTAGAVGGGDNGFPFSIRIANALISVVQYLRVLVYPQGLSVFYPHPGFSISYAAAFACGVLIIAVSVICIWYRKKQPYLLFGWLWFLATLLPVIGIVQAGIQARADRYIYMPMVGLLVAALWAGEYFFRQFAGMTRVGFAVCVCVIVVFSFVTETYISLWRSNAALFGHAARVTTNNSIAENQLGVESGKRGDLIGAERHLTASLAINPCNASALFNLANTRRMQGNIPEAIELYEKVISFSPKFADAYGNLGSLYAMSAMPEKAEKLLLKAIQLKPGSSGIHANLGLLYQGQLNRIDDAEKEYRRALAIDPQCQTALTQLGIIMRSKK